MTPPFTTLIDVPSLRTLIDGRQVRVFDCRHDLGDPGAGALAYAEGHLPGATHLHLDDDLSGSKNGRNGRHPLPDREAWIALLGRQGVDGDTQVVAYDDSGGMFAARLWWLLRWLGHERVAVLDGGLQAWRDAGETLTTDVPQFSPTVYVPRCARAAMPAVDADFVLRHLGDPTVQVVDARSPDRFRGENETLDPAGGHIPGARNRFFRDNLAANGRFKPAAELAQTFRALLGEREPAQLVHQCGSGVTACHNLLAMEYAGLPGAALYPGSWSEWCSDPQRPVASGSD